MSVLFLNAVLWPLAILVAVPLIVHLFARARPPIVDFSSVEFILRALRFTQRVRKPKDWLLLVLRTAAVAAVILLFLRPMLFSHGGGGLFERRNVVVILDASASMGWSDGSQTRFAVACAEASEILAGLSSRDAADVILAGVEPHAVFPALGGNIGYLQGEIRRARLTSEGLDPGAALRLAVRLLNGAEGRKEICIVSDFQASNWRGVKPRLPRDIGLTCVGTARGESPNTAILRVEVDPARPLPGEEVTILCDVANFSGTPQRKTVVLAVESARSSRETVIPPWGRATVLFKQRIDSSAPFTLNAALAEDGFPGDDRRWATVDPADVLRIGVLSFGKGGETAAAWSRGCRALGWARAEPLTLEALANPETRRDVLMLSGWDGTEPDRVRGFLERGVPVVWYPPVGMPLSRVMTVLTNAARSGDAGTQTVWEEDPEGFQLKVAAPDHPVFRAFSAGEYGDPARGRVRGRLAVAASQLPPGEPLMAYTDGTPALWKCRGDLPLLFWNIPLDKGISSVQNQGEFVPFLGELLLETRRGTSGAVRSARESLPGQTLTWRPGLEVRTDEVRLKGPDGAEVPLRLLEATGGTLVSDSLGRPGIYEWTAGERVMCREVVNFPSAESDLRPMSGTEIKGLGGLTAVSGRDVREWQAGIPLWPRLLWIALALLLCEGAVVASGRFA
ncbi:MAG: BatA and WFA domain-containing protein [bacterium]